MRQLVNWFRRRKLGSSLDRELRYHLESANPRFRANRAHNRGSSQAGPAGAGRRRTDTRRCAGHLADSMAAGFRLRSPLHRAIFSQDAIVHRYRRTLAHARHWSDDSDLLPRGPGAAARAACAPAGAAGFSRLERRSGRQWLRQSESHVVSHMPRSGSAEAAFRRCILPRAHDCQPLDR